MNSKALHTIQILSETGRILSRIIFICCIVGISGCAVGAFCLAVGAETLKLGGVSLHMLLETSAGVNAGTLYAVAAVGAVLCVSEGVLAKFAEVYFKRELADGTPFTGRGAGELRRLGILTVSISAGASILCAIIHKLFSRYLADVAPFDLADSGMILLGVMLIVLSVFCRYGAELAEGRGQGTEA